MARTDGRWVAAGRRPWATCAVADHYEVEPDETTWLFAVRTVAQTGHYRQLAVAASIAIPASTRIISRHSKSRFSPETRKAASHALSGTL